MQQLGTLTGQGVLIIDGAESPVTYRIVVWHGRGKKDANGTVQGNPVALWASYNAREQRLRLSSGEELKIIMTRVESEEAEIEIITPVPGY